VIAGLVLVGVLGALVGSFLNVVIYRVPRGVSIVAPPSACPACGHRIRPHDNIPILSWLLLRGRCRDCGAGIAARYPLVEAATAALFVLVGVAFLPGVMLATSPWSALAAGAVLVAYLWLAGASIALAAIDLDVHRLPNAIVLPTFAIVAGILSLAAVLTAQWDALIRLGIGALVVGGLYFLLAVAVPGGMGFGDVKLAPTLGAALAVLGWGPLAVGVLGGFVLGGVVGLVLVLARRAGRGSRVAFGPWMLAGAWVGILGGEPIARAYLSLFGLG